MKKRDYMRKRNRTNKSQYDAHTTGGRARIFFSFSGKAHTNEGVTEEFQHRTICNQ